MCFGAGGRGAEEAVHPGEHRRADTEVSRPLRVTRSAGCCQNMLILRSNALCSIRAYGPFEFSAPGRYEAETVFVSLNPMHCDTSGRISAQGQQVFEQLMCGEWDGRIPEE